MKPLYLTLQSDLSILVIPDTLAHLNGHTIITETYSIFEATNRPDPLFEASKENVEHLPYNTDPDYLGVIRFEVPDKLFTYSAGSLRSLDTEEVTELIEFLTEVRGDPRLWRL